MLRALLAEVNPAIADDDLRVHDPSAMRTEAAGIVVELAAGRALLDQEFSLGSRLKKRLVLGVHRRRRYFSVF